MFNKAGKTKLFHFRNEFETFKNSGTFPPSFFEKLESLAALAIKKHRCKPKLFGIVAEDWDEEAIHELAIDFLTQHLISINENRLNHVLDASSNGDVDYLMILIFDQFIAESIRKRFPHRSNLRNRIRKAMEQLVQEGKAVKVSGVSDQWAPLGVPQTTPIEFSKLQDEVGELPQYVCKTYNGQQRISPRISDKDLSRILSAVLSYVRAPVRLNALTELLCYRLGIWDAHFDSIEGLQEQADQQGSSFPSCVKQALSQEGEAQAVRRLSVIKNRLTERQKIMFEMHHREGKEIEEIV